MRSIALAFLAGLLGTSSMTAPNPVQKVVRMLNDMKAEIESEMEDDKAVYEKVKCWCETGEKEKTEAIELGTSKIAALESDIEGYTGKMAELKELLKNAKDEKNKDYKALEEASGMRMKENKEFHEAETDLLGAIASCKQAIVVLSKNNPDLLQVRSVAQKLRLVPVDLVSNVLNGMQSVIFKGFLQQAEKADSTSFLAIPGMQSYAPQSGQIFGILKQMKEDFEKNLAETQEEEKKAVEEFELLKAAKEQEIAAGKKLVAESEASLAEFEEKHAQASEDLKDTEDQVKTDTEFLENLKKECAAADKEYALRTKARLEEITAVQDTIGFLNGDEAHALFGKTLAGSASFLQTSSQSASESAIAAGEAWRRHRAIETLQKAALNSRSPRLVLLATSVRLDAFTKVKEEIDKMIAELKKQSADEIKQRDWCIAELDKTNRTLEAKYDKQASLMAKMADLEKSIETFQKSIQEKTKEIADMQTQMKRASEDREAENADFQQTVTEQRVTQSILQAAADRMKQTFALLQKRVVHRHHHQPGTQLTQVSVSDTILAAFGGAQEPGAPQMQLSGTDTEPGSAPARFKEYEQNAGGKKVITMIEQCIEDAKKSEAEAIASEQDSQTAYQNFMKDSNESIIKYTKAINNMSEELAKAKEELVNTKEDLDSVNTDIQDLSETDADLHKSCDFLLQNFDVRQQARADEVDALNEAKAILSGAK